ncbi:MAG: hypothetical protein ACXVEE_06600 [Polyangiales bacterium]
MHPSQMEEIVRRLVADPNDQAALGAAYADGQRDPRGYATLLERVGELTHDTTFAAHWLSEAAHVWSTTLGDARRAATLLMRAIDKDPASDVASDRLAGLYREKGDHRALVALYERRAKALAGVLNGDPALAQRLSMLHEDLGRLWQEPPLSQPRKAVENFKKAFEVDPSAVSAIYAARELLKAEGNFKEALPLYDAEIRAIDDTERKLALYRDEASVRQQSGDTKGATQTLRNALQLDPGDTGLQYELATSIVTRIQGNKEKVPDNERAEAAELLVNMAQMYDGEHALAYSEAALDAQPGHDRAMQLAAHYAGQLGRDVTERWAGYVKASPDGGLAFEGRKTLARTYEQQGRIDDAIKALEPVKDDPDPSIMVRLGDLYAKAGNTTALAQHMDRHAASLPPHERISKVLEIAALLAQKNDKKGALAKYREVLEMDPQHPEALAYVEDQLRSTRQYRELRDLLLNAARVSSASVESRKSQLREVAGLSEQQLKDPEGAITAYRQLLSFDRMDESARSALHRLLEKGQKWDDLAALIEQEAMAAADPEEQIALEKKLADLHEKKRGDKREAAEALLRVVAHAPKDEESLGRAIELLVAVEDSSRAAAALDEYVGALDAGEGKGKLLLRLGELREGLGDQHGASDAYAEAGELLHSEDAWRRAEEAAVKVERWDQAANAVGRRGDLVRDSKAQARHRASEADYLIRSGDASSALLRLEQAVEIAPDDDELADRLERTYEQEGRLDDLAGYIVRRAEGSRDKTKSIGHFKRAAAFRKDRLADPDGARDLLLRVVEGTEDVEALSMLAEDADGREDHASAIEYLRRLEPLAADRRDRIRIAVRQAQITADGLGDVDGAIARYKTILEKMDENCREALQAIADLEQARERYPEAADALERDLELAQPGEEKANIARRLGEIYIDHTRELGKSLAAYETVIREDPEDFAALHKLRELSERAEKWPRVIELLDQQIEVEGDDDEIATLTARKAEVLADHLNQVADALRTLAPFTAAGSDVARASALAIADRHGADAQIGGQILAWARTTGGAEGQRLLGEAFDRFIAGNALDRALEVAPDVLRTPRAKDAAFLEQTEKLAVDAKALELVLELHDRRGAMLSGPARSEELVRQAKVRVGLGVDPQEAMEHGEIGLGVIPPAEGGALLESLAELAPTPLAAVELYERQVSRCKSPADRLAAIARAYRRAIETPDRSAAVVAKAKELVELALGISNADDPFEALWNSAAEVDERRGQSEERRALIDVLVTSGAGPRDGGRTRSAQLRRAAERIRELGDEEASHELLAQALIAHVDPATLDAIEQTAEPRRAEAILSRALEEVFDGPLVRQLIARRATLRREKLDDFDGALRDLKKLHELAPADTAVTEKYRELLTEANDYRGLIQLHEDQILRSKDQGVRADMARSIARLWEERLGDAREAADAWRRVLRLKPQDPEATAGLDRAKRNKLQFEEGKYPAQRVVPDGSIAPPAPQAQAKGWKPLVARKAVSEPPPEDSGFASETITTATRVTSDSDTPPPRQLAPRAEISTRPPETEVTTPEERIDTAVGGRSRLDIQEVPETTAEIQFQPAATDAYQALPNLADEDEDMATIVGDSAALAVKDVREAQAQARHHDRLHGLHDREPAVTDEVPALMLPKSAAGADPDGSAEFISDDEVVEVDDEAEILDEDVDDLSHPKAK